jgi:hypothetical protein
MTTACHPLLIVTSTSHHTVRGPTDLRKSIKQRPRNCRNLWEATHINAKHSKPVMNLDVQAPRTHPVQSDITQPHPSNPHRRS